MTNALKSFIGGAFALIGLFLVLAHSGGFAKDISASTSGASNVFKTLQGR